MTQKKGNLCCYDYCINLFVLCGHFFDRRLFFSEVIQGKPQIKRNMFRWKRFSLNTHAVWCLGTERTSGTENKSQTLIFAAICCSNTEGSFVILNLLSFYLNNVDFDKRYLFCCITYMLVLIIVKF